MSTLDTLDEMAWWILRDGEPVKVPNQEWSNWMMLPFEETRRIARDSIGDVDVSTVFLSVDHAWGGGPPVLFETMIFGGDHDGWQDRYHTLAAAQAGHLRVLRVLRDGGDPGDG